MALIIGDHQDNLLHYIDYFESHHILGGEGDDTIHGGGNDDLLDGGLHDDELHGGAGNDTLHGGNGQDTLNGNSGNDTVHGDAGNDTIFDDTSSSFHEGSDTYFGGDGTDYLYYTHEVSGAFNFYQIAGYYLGIHHTHTGEMDYVAPDVEYIGFADTAAVTFWAYWANATQL